MTIDAVLAGVEVDPNLKSPEVSSGRCFIETTKILSSLEVKAKYMYAENRFNPVEVFDNSGQRGNHYAIYFPQYNRVVDYTISQFNQDCPFPFIGTQREWKNILKDAWDVGKIHSKSFDTLDQIKEWTIHERL